MKHSSLRFVLFLCSISRAHEVRDPSHTIKLSPRIPLRPLRHCRNSIVKTIVEFYLSNALRYFLRSLCSLDFPPGRPKLRNYGSDGPLGCEREVAAAVSGAYQRLLLKQWAKHN